MDELLHLQGDVQLAVAESDAKSQVVAESDAHPVCLVAHLEVSVAMVVASACSLQALESLATASLATAWLAELVVVAMAESVA